MSEDDRATKAARAKALLKKRQQQKTLNAAASSNPGVATPPRTFSPVIQEPTIEEGIRDSGELFSNSKDTSDTSWLTSLSRTIPLPQYNNITPASPSSLAASPSQFAQDLPSAVITLQDKIDALSKQNETLTLETSRAAQQADILLQDGRRRTEEFKAKYDNLQMEMETALESERRTVSLLVNEKVHIASKLEKLEEAESKYQVLEDLLEAERANCADLEERASQLQIEFTDLSGRFQETKMKEKESLDHNKEMERQLQIAAAETTSSRKAADDFQRRFRELEEQVQADDRAERLEVSLKNTQDRADELEFQLAKVKQSYASLKLERDGLESELQQVATAESEWSSKSLSLEHQLTSTRDQVFKLEAEYRNLCEQKLKYEQQAEANENTTNEAKDQLDRATSTITTVTRQLQHSQIELKNALRRAQDAENVQHSLQTEGTTLMRSLDEMRPKIVELTGARLDLLEKVEGLESALQNRDLTISQLENDLSETRDSLEQSEVYWKNQAVQHERQVADAERATTDVQNAYVELQEELNVLLASLRNLEAERSNNHQEASRHLQEIERLSHLAQLQDEQLDILKHELEAIKQSYHEEQEFLERAHSEIEVLRSELSSREEELILLRESASKPNSNGTRSLDEELLSSLRQQQALELSAATSQVRALENIIFDKDRAIHNLQKQVNGLEEHHVKPNLHPISKASGRNGDSLLSLHTHQPSLPSTLARTVFDQVMTPETFHKRRVSLNMLKVRMESEARANFTRALSPMRSDHITSRPPSVVSPQFLDESHVFWCYSCSGDLVIL